MFKFRLSIWLLFIVASNCETTCPLDETLIDGQCWPIVAELYCNDIKCSENMGCDQFNKCVCLPGYIEYYDADDDWKQKCGKFDVQPESSTNGIPPKSSTTHDPNKSSSDLTTYAPDEEYIKEISNLTTDPIYEPDRSLKDNKSVKQIIFQLTV